MKRWIVVSLAVLAFLSAFLGGQLWDKAVGFSEKQPVNHIVLFHLKPTTSEADVSAMLSDAKVLLKKIPGVLDVTIGRKALDNRDVHIKDYEVGLYIKLSEVSDLKVYAPSPEHQEFMRKNSQKIDSFKVIDFYGT